MNRKALCLYPEDEDDAIALIKKWGSTGLVALFPHQNCGYAPPQGCHFFRERRRVGNYFEAAAEAVRVAFPSIRTISHQSPGWGGNSDYSDDINKASKVGSWAPGLTENDRKWRGHFPWSESEKGNLVEVVIPTILTSDLLPTTIELIRRQSGLVRPYFVLIDTGSPPEEQRRVQDMQADDVEVHLLRSGGYGHASAPVAAALDLALSLCRTEVQVLTHADCFLRRRDALESLVSKVGEKSPVVGYQISPRPTVKKWENMTGHTWTALHVPTIRRAGISWGYGASLDHNPGEVGGHWDTEYGFSRQCWSSGIQPIMLGTEKNFERNINADFDHIRSLPGSRLFKSAHLPKAESWVADAMSLAKERIAVWSGSEYGK